MVKSDADHARSQRISLIGLMINVGLSFVKLMAGLIGHSYALIADAIESMADIVASAVVWRGVTIAAQPADDEHPYGHGRAEALAAAIVALMIIGAGIGIAVGAVGELVRSGHERPAQFTLWVLIAVVIIKETLFRVMRGVATEVGSGAVRTDAWHQRSDAITSAAAAVGISLAVFGGPAYYAADDWAALLASSVILYNGYRLTRAPIRELMDAQPTEIVDRARAVAETVDNVKAVEKAYARKTGLRYLVDMHIHVDPQMSVAKAHAIAHEAKGKICTEMPNVLDVLIHIEPFSKDEESNVG